MIDTEILPAGVATLEPPVPAPRAAAAWSPDSWRHHPAEQQPDWPDPAHLDDVAGRLAALPPLVMPAEVLDLRRSLADVAAGRAFLVQAGDCAERFDACTEDGIRGKIRVILQLATLLTYSSGLPVVRVGRIAGQYGKPRTNPTETVDGRELPVYRGDMVNAPEPTDEARRPDPERLLLGYHRAAATLNLLRALGRDADTDIHAAHDRTTAHVRRRRGSGPAAALADDLARAVRFMSAMASDPAGVRPLFTSHEALIPQFEQALTRLDPASRGWFATSAHMLWVGNRTRRPGSAHVELLAGVENPVGVKLGPTTTPSELRELCERLDPGRRPGRLVLISRMGAAHVRDVLPPLLRSVRAAGHPVVWVCDPMHGNTISAPSGHKTRRLPDILAEIDGFFAAHRAEGTHPGGIHLELTGEDVTECLGGEVDEVLDAHLGDRYESACDPRLNASQSIDVAFHLAALLREHPRA